MSKFLHVTYVCQVYLPSRKLHVQVNKRNSRTGCEICSKLTIKTPERRQWLQWRHCGVFIVHFNHISHLVLVFLLLTLNG